MSTNPPVTTPTADMVARAWHALSDHALDGVPLDGTGCTCRNYASHVKAVVDLLTGQPNDEPDGLGAVVVNPLTDKVYVRDAHPNLPWHNPEDDSPQHWSDPSNEDWFTWAELPRPLVIQSTGWTPPAPTPSPPESEPRRFVPEPTGIGAVVDTADELWVRVPGSDRPWRKINQSTQRGVGDARVGFAQVARWDELDQPVAIRSHGWQQS